ncbi:MAG: aspartate carbamoyltransferase regulatory subunit [Clostridia bacterium]|nr:aspartate carbamoyltransferase regulatory subunit [Clostridia bacterium]
MEVTSIKNGIVFDHIKAGQAMKLYEILNLDKLKCQVAIIKNAQSKRMGKKDVLKINDSIDIDLDVIGYFDPEITVNVIRDGILEKRARLELPKTVTNVIKCKNPRCITSVEQNLPHIFKLTNAENKIYRCIYCESKAK